MTLTEAAATPEVAEILASDGQHTEVARKITELGYPTSEASVRRWRAIRAWAASREVAVGSMARSPVPVAPDLAAQGYLLSEAMRPVDLPDNPVTVLGYLEPYIGAGQKNLRALRRATRTGSRR